MTMSTRTRAAVIATSIVLSMPAGAAAQARYTATRAGDTVTLRDVPVGRGG